MTGVRWPGDGVRPTLRCMRQDLQVALPTADVSLEDVPHELVGKAQRIPELDAAGGAERIVSVRDRIWLKVKTSGWRGAILPPAAVDDVKPLWWLGAAGHRQADSEQHDFYARFAAECDRCGAAAGTSCDSRSFLPAEEDEHRLSVERALAGVRTTKALVRSLARQSLNTGHACTASVLGWEISILIRTDGTRIAAAYIAIGATGVTDPGTYATLLAAVPGVAPDDWQPEPTEVLGIHAHPGQIVFSALISPEAQALLLAE